MQAIADELIRLEVVEHITDSTRDEQNVLDGREQGSGKGGVEKATGKRE